ncbi:MAG TPA: hypothetical protein VK550_33350 [Polyangiaceae bacterium]|nr:hypothetical protein [Polyangiaceae bacterium]
MLDFAGEHFDRNGLNMRLILRFAVHVHANEFPDSPNPAPVKLVIEFDGEDQFLWSIGVGHHVTLVHRPLVRS